MSELIAIDDLYERRIRNGSDPYKIKLVDVRHPPVYLKSEADEVIAEKDKQLRHQKYKRCLDRAEMCQAKYDEEDAKVNGRGASWDYTSQEMKYWERWRWRWDALSDKFKEAK